MQNEVYIFPTSFAQQQLWFLDQWSAGSPFYNIPLGVRIDGPLNVKALEMSITQIVRRHEILRTTFSTVAGEPVQVISPAHTIRQWRLPMVDMRDLLEDEREIQVRHLTDQDIQNVFHLSTGPLLRTMLLRLSSDGYIFLATTHHIVFDAWSSTLFLNELLINYEAYCAGKSFSLPALSLQYADFTLWQKEQLQGDTLENLLTYWKRQLDGIPGLLELPTDRLRPTAQTFQGASYPFTLSQALLENLYRISRQEQVTLFMTLLAAFKVLLYRYTMQGDIVIGSPTANRPQDELEQLIGLFVNMLVLRTDVSGNPGFREVLSRVKKVVLEAHAHQDLPFGLLVNTLQLKRDSGRNPLFQVMFTFHNAPRETATSAQLRITPLEVKNAISRLDLTLELVETVDGLSGFFEYKTELFTEATIQRLCAHFQVLLEGIIATPDLPVSQLPLLTPAEWQAFFEDTLTASSFVPYQCVHQQFSYQAQKTPHAIAVSFQEHQLSYLALEQRSNQLAYVLQKHGISPEQRVAILLDRSLDLLAVLLAVLKAGGAYVPLDVFYPVERISFMLNDAQVSLVLTNQTLQALLPISDTPVLCLETLFPQLATAPKTMPNGLICLEHLAYVLYTSGSTGQPKGVQISHEALSSFLQAMQARLQLSSQERWLAVTTLSFDIAALEFFLPLTIGACIILAPTEVLANGSRLRALIEYSQTSIMQATPITWRLLLEAGWGNEGPSLQVLCGGETFPLDLREPLQQRARCLWNLYGPTEATIWATAHALVPTEPPNSIPLGRPLANIHCYVLTTSLQPVPIGVIGEIFLGGKGVARGYLHQPRLTAERFLPDPFSSQAGSRLYCTGDLGYWQADRQLMYVGRRDGQVKLHGHRIELGEIEAQLSRLPGVSTAIVQVQQERLLAYVVGVERLEEKQVRLWRQALRKCLPAYMVPTGFVPLPQIPLTLNGKIDQKVLRAMKPVQPEQRRSIVAARNRREQLLVTIWAQILSIPQIGVEDNFFELGGDSILCTHIVATAARAGLHFTVQDIFQYQTIETLAEVVVEQPQSSAPEERKHMMQAGNRPTQDVVSVPLRGVSEQTLQKLSAFLEKDRKR